MARVATICNAISSPSCQTRRKDLKKTHFELVRTEPVILVCALNVVHVLLIASMMASGSQKCTAAAKTNPLDDAGILERVLSYVPGQWLFLAAVSSLCKDIYSKLTATKVQKISLSNVGEIKKADVNCAQDATLYSSVFGSPSRVRYAHASGVDCSTVGYQFAAGRHATVASLITARELGMKYSLAVVKGVADSNTLPVMQFLHAQAVLGMKRSHLELLKEEIWRCCVGCASMGVTGIQGPL
jgi:hypothetical protein